MAHPPFAIVLVESTQGKASVGVRVGKTSTIQLLEGWEDLSPLEAVRIAMDIAEGEISPEDLAAKKYREWNLPESYTIRKLEQGE